jgi:toxin HigB-1
MHYNIRHDEEFTMAIITFADSMTEALFHDGQHRRFPSDVAERAFKKLRRLHATDTVNALRIPPSNHLEKMHGDRLGQWSIRVNNQWRICFIFEDGDAFDVQILDYH